CPAHEDRTASLCIGIGDDGRTLVHCQAGCDTRAVVDSAGMMMVDLAPPDFRSNGYSPATDRSGRTIESTHWYLTDQGEKEFQVVKYRNADGTKTFRQRRQKPGGGWDWSVKGCRILPYHLPELLKSTGTV